MKEPEKPWPPHKWEYEQEYTEEPIIDIDMITNEDRDMEEYLDDWKDQHDWKEGDHLPEITDFGYHNDMGTVADLLKKIPEGMPLEDVVITINRDRMIDYVNFSVTYRRPTDKKALKSSYLQALKEYKQKEKQYQTDLAEYQEWQKQEEIRQLEEKLAKLKK